MYQLIPSEMIVMFSNWTVTANGAASISTESKVW
jgi:hypothetical protein